MQQSSSKTVNFANLRLDSYKKSQLNFNLKKLFKFLIIILASIFFSLFYLRADLSKLIETSGEYQVIKQYIQDQKELYHNKRKNLLDKQVALKARDIKLKTLKNSPIKLLNQISFNIPDDIRLEEFNFKSKDSLKITCISQTARSVILFLENLNNDIFVPPCSLTASSYNINNKNYKFIISFYI